MFEFEYIFCPRPSFSEASLAFSNECILQVTVNKEIPRQFVRVSSVTFLVERLFLRTFPVFRDPFGFPDFSC